MYFFLIDSYNVEFVSLFQWIKAEDAERKTCILIFVKSSETRSLVVHEHDIVGRNSVE